MPLIQLLAEQASADNFHCFMLSHVQATMRRHGLIVCLAQIPQAPRWPEWPGWSIFATHFALDRFDHGPSCSRSSVPTFASTEMHLQAACLLTVDFVQPVGLHHHHVPDRNPMPCLPIPGAPSRMHICPDPIPLLSTTLPSGSACDAGQYMGRPATAKAPRRRKASFPLPLALTTESRPQV